jgi:hypothetical protein
MPTRKEQLKIDIARLQAELEIIEAPITSTPVLRLSDYTTEEKVAFFDSMYKLAFDTIKEVKENGYCSEDTENWFYETGFAILNLRDTKALWKYKNSLS